MLQNIAVRAVALTDRAVEHDLVAAAHRRVGGYLNELQEDDLYVFRQHRNDLTHLRGIATGIGGYPGALYGVSRGAVAILNGQIDVIHGDLSAIVRYIGRSEDGRGRAVDRLIVEVACEHRCFCIGLNGQRLRELRGVTTGIGRGVGPNSGLSFFTRSVSHLIGEGDRHVGTGIRSGDLTKVGCFAVPNRQIGRSSVEYGSREVADGNGLRRFCHVSAGIGDSTLPLNDHFTHTGSVLGRGGDRLVDLLIGAGGREYEVRSGNGVSAVEREVLWYLNDQLARSRGIAVDDDVGSAGRHIATVIGVSKGDRDHRFRSGCRQTGRVEVGAHGNGLTQVRRRIGSVDVHPGIYRRQNISVVTVDRQIFRLDTTRWSEIDQGKGRALGQRVATGIGIGEGHGNATMNSATIDDEVSRIVVIGEGCRRTAVRNDDVETGIVVQEVLQRIAYGQVRFHNGILRSANDDRNATEYGSRIILPEGVAREVGVVAERVDPVVRKVGHGKATAGRVGDDVQILIDHQTGYPRLILQRFRVRNVTRGQFYGQLDGKGLRGLQNASVEENFRHRECSGVACSQRGVRRSGGTADVHTHQLHKSSSESSLQIVRQTEVA